jgi:hypothetical protein
MPRAPQNSHQHQPEFFLLPPTHHFGPVLAPKGEMNHDVCMPVEIKTMTSRAQKAHHTLKIIGKKMMEWQRAWGDVT